jgi:tetratricopeptide (TPR) repeat protein
MPQRQVTIQGNAEHTIIITGDNNQVHLGHQGGFVFRLLDEAFRQAQAAGQAADFYNGARPNWANIARQQDAPRTLFPSLMDFILHGTPAQRLGVISGLSGEGKTTLLMRAAWEAARQGLPVLWRHYGHVTQPYEHPFEQDGPLLICLDELPYVDELPALLSDLNESGLPFVLLGTARLHEWYNSPLRPEVERRVTVQEFRLERLDEREAHALLERLEANNALGALQEKTPSARLDYLLGRLQADGQLLPALMTSRAGRSFEAILETVFTNLEKRYREERVAFLLRGYAGIALVHRFGFWISRRLLAEFLPCPEAELTPHLLSPLRGELTEITEEEAGRLSTRHPWIAERALGLLAGRRLPEERYLYQDLFAALGRVLGADPGAEERKLNTKLPLAFKYQGCIAEARRLFQQASQADPKNAPTWQAWAILEKEQGNIDEARRLFQQAIQADPKNAPTLQAWAILEKEQGTLTKPAASSSRPSRPTPKTPPPSRPGRSWKKSMATLTKPAASSSRPPGRPQRRPLLAGLGAPGKRAGTDRRSPPPLPAGHASQSQRPRLLAGLGAPGKRAGTDRRSPPPLPAGHPGRPQKRPHPPGLGAPGKRAGTDRRSPPPLPAGHASQSQRPRLLAGLGAPGKRAGTDRRSPPSLPAGQPGRPPTRPHPPGLGAPGKRAGTDRRSPPPLPAGHPGRPQTRPHPPGLGAPGKRAGKH